MCPVHPERAATSLRATRAPRRPMRWQCLRVARDPHRCLPAAGPRATPSTPSDEPEQREYLLFANFLFAPDFMVLLFVLFLAVSLCAVFLSRVVSVSEC